MVIVCTKRDPSSIYQDLFNSQHFPVNGLAARRVLGYPLQGTKAGPNELLGINEKLD